MSKSLIPFAFGLSIGVGPLLFTSNPWILGIGIFFSSIYWWLYFESRIEAPCGLAAMYVEGMVRGKYDPVLPEKGAKSVKGLMHNLNVLAQELKAQSLRMKNLESLRIDFVANVSHELKTPLTSIRGYTETLLDGAVKDPETASKFLKRIEENAIRLDGLVSDLLYLAKLERFPTELDWQSFSSAEFVLKIDETLYPNLKKRNQKLKFDFQNSTIEGDREKLFQVFLNLIDNASRYSSENSLIMASQKQGDGYKIYEVRDNGPGIDPQNLDRVFERFYRVDKARSRETGGTGLGLAIVKHIVLSHGGQIWVESQPGQGSRFIFKIPTRDVNPILT